MYFLNLGVKGLIIAVHKPARACSVTLRHRDSKLLSMPSKSAESEHRNHTVRQHFGHLLLEEDAPFSAVAH